MRIIICVLHAHNFIYLLTYTIFVHFWNWRVLCFSVRDMPDNYTRIRNNRGRTSVCLQGQGRKTRINHVWMIFTLKQLQAELETKGFLKSTIKKYYANENKTAVAVMWDHLQIQLSCCGVDNYEDYGWSGSKRIPESCCALKKDHTLVSPDCATSLNENTSYYQKVIFLNLGITKFWPIFLIV